MVVWIIGLSGSGKSTLANEVMTIAKRTKSNVVLLDGDAIREIFGNDLGHTLEDRKKNAWRICQLGKFLSDQGVHVVVSILSLFPETRQWNRDQLKSYFEVYIDAPLDQLQARDSKGIYGRYARGETKNVAGLDLDFPVPSHADLVIKNAAGREALLAHAQVIAARLTASSEGQ